MLERLEILNSRAAVLSLPMFDSLSGYEVRDIDGLDPVAAVLVSSSFANKDGEEFQSAKRVKRNILPKLGIAPDYTSESVAQLRNNLYNWFMPKSWVKLSFFSDDDFPTVEIEGRVETMEAPRFGANSKKADISIVCFDPDFIVPTPVTFEGDTTSGTTESELTYSGSVDTGFVFRLFVDRTINEFTIYQRLADNTINTMDFESPIDLVAGDVLEISTVAGSKGAWYTRSGVKSSILYAISPTSAWPRLDPGVNNIRVYAAGAAIPYSLEYRVRYGGL